MAQSSYSLNFEQFHALSARGNLIPCPQSISSSLNAFAKDIAQVGE
jgi:hypothetical protein